MTVLTKPFTGALAKKPEAGTDDDKLLIKVNILFFIQGDSDSRKLKLVKTETKKKL